MRRPPLRGIYFPSDLWSWRLSWGSFRHVGSCSSHLQIWGIRTDLLCSADECFDSTIRRTASPRSCCSVWQTLWCKHSFWNANCWMHPLLNVGGKTCGVSDLFCFIRSNLVRRVCLQFLLSCTQHSTGVCSFSPRGVKVLQWRQELLPLLNFYSISDLQSIVCWSSSSSSPSWETRQFLLQVFPQRRWEGGGGGGLLKVQKLRWWRLEHHEWAGLSFGTALHFQSNVIFTCELF